MLFALPGVWTLPLRFVRSGEDVGELRSGEAADWLAAYRCALRSGLA